MAYIALLATAFFGVQQASADDNSLWTNSGTITKTVVAEDISSSSSYYDKQCTRLPQKEKKYRYQGSLRIEDGYTSITSACWTKTDYGLFGRSDQTAYMRFGNSDPVAAFDDWSSTYLPVPNSNRLLKKYNNGSSSTSGLILYENVAASFNLTNRGYSDKFVEASSPPGRVTLKDPLGQSLSVGAIGVSNNGEWLVLEGSGSFYRFNLSTKEVLAFEKPLLTYGQGTNPHYELSISDDGRYAVIGAGNVYTQYFKVYDLSSCSYNSSKPFEVSPGCKKRDLKSELFPSTPAEAGATNIVFDSTNENISFSFVENGKTNRYVITAPGKGHLLQYLALGDSYSSGEGDEDDLDYIIGTNGDGEFINDVGIAGFPYWKEKCHLSDRSYPYLLGGTYGDKFRSVACTGSTLNDVINNRNAGEGVYLGRYSQMDGFRATENLIRKVKNTALESFISGRASQIEFIQKYKPAVVTIGIGGNDVGFGEKIAACIPTVNTCEFASTKRTQTAKEISELYEKLVEAYVQLRNASPTTRFYAVGYPQLVTTGGVCKANVLLDEHEREYAVQVVSYLNKTVAAAAAKAGIFYLDIKDALAGNNLCSSANKIAVNGLRRGDDRSLTGHEVRGFGYVGNESFHPNQIGHELIAKAIKTQINDRTITSYNPCAPSVALTCSQINGDRPSVPAYFNTTGDEISTVRGVLSTAGTVAGMTGELVKRTGEIVVETTGQAFKSLSEVEITLHSTPVSLGKYTTNSVGALVSTVKIPADTEPGYHTIHAVGVTQGGEKIDYYKTIFVYADADDWDGDGVANEDDKCGFVNSINEDFDEDGIDDACDGFVGDPKPVEIIVPSQSNPAPASSIQNATGNSIQETAVRMALATASDQVPLEGFVAGASTTNVSYFGASSDHQEAATVEKAGNFALVAGAVIAASLVGVIVFVRAFIFTSR